MHTAQGWGNEDGHTTSGTGGGEGPKGSEEMEYLLKILLPIFFSVSPLSLIHS